MNAVKSQVIEASGWPKAAFGTHVDSERQLDKTWSLVSLTETRSTSTILEQHKYQICQLLRCQKHTRRIELAELQSLTLQQQNPNKQMKYTHVSVDTLL